MRFSFVWEWFGLVSPALMHLFMIRLSHFFALDKPASKTQSLPTFLPFPSLSSLLHLTLLPFNNSHIHSLSSRSYSLFGPYRENLMLTHNFSTLNVIYIKPGEKSSQIFYSVAHLVCYKHFQEKNYQFFEEKCTLTRGAHSTKHGHKYLT